MGNGFYEDYPCINPYLHLAKEWNQHIRIRSVTFTEIAAKDNCSNDLPLTDLCKKVKE